MESDCPRGFCRLPTLTIGALTRRLIDSTIGLQHITAGLLFGFFCAREAGCPVAMVVVVGMMQQMGSPWPLQAELQVFGNQAVIELQAD